MRPKLDVTITDVAEKAGVSIATVSRLINGVGTIGEKTEKRVREAIQETGYKAKPKGRPNGKTSKSAAGSSLAPLAFLRIGEFNPEIQSPVTKHLETALQKTVKSQGRPFSSHTITDFQSASVREVIGKAEGVVIRTSNTVDVDREAMAWLEGIPAVQVLGESRTGRHWTDHLGPDNEQAGAMAAEYLLSQGCSRLVFASTNILTRNVGLQRCSSFVKYATAAGAECQVIFQAPAPDHERIKNSLCSLSAYCRVFEKRHEMIQHIAAENPDSFGLFVPTDLELSLVMTQLEMLGVDFKKRCHPIGCDREIRCFTGLEHLPATLDLLIDNLAERAIRRLLFRIAHPDEPLVRLMVSPKVVFPQNLVGE